MKYFRKRAYDSMKVVENMDSQWKLPVFRTNCAQRKDEEGINVYERNKTHDFSAATALFEDFYVSENFFTQKKTLKHILGP